MNTMSVEMERELADRIRARGFNWKRAFEAWYLVNGDAPCFVREPDGALTLERPPREFIKTNLGNLPALGLQDIVQRDGTLRLDPDHHYRPVGDLGWGFTAYQRITEEQT